MSRSIWKTLHAVALVALLATAGCAPQTADEAPDATAAATEPEPAREIHPFAAAIEAAHRSDLWRSHDALAADVLVEFGGNTLFDGRLTTSPDAAHTHTVRASDGAVLVFDGNTAWVSPADAEWQGARFHALTWGYFLSAPHKLADPGAHLEAEGPRDLHGAAHETARLTFDAGVGDAPDDWYVVYRDPETDRLAALAYIITFGTPTEEAEKDPHVIVYRDYVEVEGVPIPTVGDFYNWNEEDGAHGDPIGRMTLSNPEFVATDDGTFAAPEGAREEGMPAPAA